MNLPPINARAILARLRHAHPVALALGLLGTLTILFATLGHARQALAEPGQPSPLSTLLPDGRSDTNQVRFDNLLMTKLPGWTKRTGEWSGQWTLEGPDFKTRRFQITAFYAVGLDDRGLAGIADAVDKNSKTYIEFKEEAPRVESTHPAGYKQLTSFTSVKAEGYGKDCRLYTMHVYLEANNLCSRIDYSAAYRENFDLHLPTFQAFLKNVRLLSAQTLAPAFADQPVLEQFTVNQCCDFLEWLLDVPLTDTQRSAARDYFTQVWTRKDQTEAAGLWDVFKGRNELDKLPKDKKELGRTAARAEVLKQWRDEAAKGDKMARMMIDVYDAAHAPIAQGKPGEPSLTRQQSDSVLEILHFMAGKVAGFDVAPSEQQKTEFATKLAAQYASIDPETRKEFEQMPLYWAWFRAAWPETPADERTRLTQQWAADERIKPIVTQLNDLKAKALASGIEPTRQLDALRKLYQQQQTVSMISNMMAMQHRTNMTIINNIGSSNTRYEYKYVYRYR